MHSVAHSKCSINSFYKNYAVYSLDNHTQLEFNFHFIDNETEAWHGEIIEMRTQVINGGAWIIMQTFQQTSILSTYLCNLFQRTTYKVVFFEDSWLSFSI